MGLGCLGEFMGEMLGYAALAALAGLLVLALRGLDALLQARPAIASAILATLAALFTYGLVWTIRVRPGLYLENLKGDARRQEVIGRDRRRPRIAAMILFQVVCASAVGYVVTLVVWSRP